MSGKQRPLYVVEYAHIDSDSVTRRKEYVSLASACRFIGRADIIFLAMYPA